MPIHYCNNNPNNKPIPVTKEVAPLAAIDVDLVSIMESFGVRSIWKPIPGKDGNGKEFSNVLNNDPISTTQVQALLDEFETELSKLEDAPKEGQADFDEIWETIEMARCVSKGIGTLAIAKALLWAVVQMELFAESCSLKKIPKKRIKKEVKDVPALAQQQTVGEAPDAQHLPSVAAQG